MQLMMALTQSIQALGGRFEQMGESFEHKLAAIENRHKELEAKLKCQRLIRKKRTKAAQLRKLVKRIN